MTGGTWGLVASIDLAQGEVYRDFLGQAGVAAVVVRDGREAQELVAHRGAPAIAVIDPSLPRIDGFALAAAIRAFHGPEVTPILFATAFDELAEAALRLKERLGVAAVFGRDGGAALARAGRTVKQALEGEHISDTPRPPARRPPPRPAVPPGAVRLHDEPLGAIAADVRRALGVAFAAVALLEGERTLIPASVGVTAELPEVGRFLRAVAAARTGLCIPDAAGHPFFDAARPALLGGYAAWPVWSVGGEVTGVLCVGDDQPLALTPVELDLLAVHARRVAGELEQRVAVPPTTLPIEATPALSAVAGALAEGVALMVGGKVVYANAALGALSSLAPLELEGLPRDTFVAAVAALASDPAVVVEALRVVPGAPYAGQAELEVTRPSRRVLRWTARPVPVGDGVGQLELLSDVTAEVDLRRERELFARTDWLTGLANRRGGEDAIAREVARARRNGTPLCFALFDLDRFQAVNELHGRAIGDEILREVARVVRASVRGSDVAIRWVDDDLLVVLPGIVEAGARAFAERLRKRVAALELESCPSVTVSAGVAELARFEDAQVVIARASARVGEAKQAGRNRVV
jgi:diguanylate cyclase (GGDEF)-like protein